MNRAGAALALTPDMPGAWRHRLVLVLLAGGACLILGRAFYLQVLDAGFLNHQGDIRFIRTVTLPGFRGAITANDGSPLALSAPVESIWATPAEVLAKPEYLPALAQLLDQKESDLRRYLKARSTRRFVFLKRQMAPDAAERVLALHAPGIYSQRDYRRYYPAGAVTAQVVGYTDIDGKGQTGVESAANDVLRGINGERGVVRDGTGRVVQDTEHYKPAQPGQDVRLTLDLRLQYLAFRELQAAVTAHGAQSGSMVVADPRTGAILALVNVPSYNPNDSSQRTSEGLRNRALSETFEPGSTVKPLLVAEALASGKFSPGDRIATDGGTYRVGPMTIHDDDDFGVLDLRGLLQKSSNIAAAKIGLALGPKAVWTGYHNFGLDRRTGVNLPGEALPTLRPWQDWRDVATATASYGYGIAVSALDLLRAYCAIANDGLMPQLHIDADRDVPPPTRALPAVDARTVRSMLQSVVSPDGTAPKAAVEGYRVAGKTGTARMTVDGRYASGKYHALFVGMLPADRPQLVAVVVINAPKGYNYFGGSVAAPVFSSVIGAAARLLQIAPDMPTTRLTAQVGGGT
ncbi:MAG: penicillin-binding protein 2 [Nevskiaceae bacterium]|nr:MAG: penicillin-binding protein 2 [Nevskiaceae bacterium]TBR73380.1 MAG: penicillin-binding protein 2 [Nevskiaceae bacterium]